MSSTTEDIPYIARAFKDANIFPNPDVFTKYSNNTKQVKEQFGIIYPNYTESQKKQAWDDYRSMGDEYRREFYNMLTGFLKKAEHEEFQNKQITQQEVTAKDLESQIEKLNKELAFAKNETFQLKRKMEKTNGVFEENKKLKTQIETMRECMGFMSRLPQGEGDFSSKMKKVPER